MVGPFTKQARRDFLRASGQLATGVTVGASTATAASKAVREPAVIGYHNRKGLTIERVSYPARNMGTTIVANLFQPAGFDAKRKYATVVVTHPFGGVKEQTSGLYAQHLAEQGFLTLAYDACYQGESGGQPRLMEVPAQRLDDISCAIDFLVKHPQVDAGRIGSLGICAGGGYALCNAATEMRVKAVASVSTFNLGEARREGMGTISYEERMRRLRDAAEARSRESVGEPVRLVPVVPDNPDGFTEKTPQLYREGYDYYRTPRAQHPNSPNRYVFSSLPQQMAFFPFEQIETISPRPLLVIAGSKADTLFWSEEVIKKAKEPKELHLIEGATHMDMYDRPQFVTPAVAKLAAFFGRM
ncbi:MAG: alpha/beta hydrolase [Bryobacterales bacterium]|nr:alpha/beta hydrolase [Bryobacterales bacterium]